MNFPMRACASALISIIALIGMGATAQAAKLADPPKREFGCSLNEEKTFYAIESALHGREWRIITNELAGHLVAEIIVKNKHMLRVAIVYTDAWYDIDYNNSRKLEFQMKRNGSAIINGAANDWMDDIDNDIAVNISSLCKIS